MAIAPARGWAGVDLVLSGKSEAVVAAGDRAAVLQGAEIHLLSGDGRVLRRLGSPSRAVPGDDSPAPRADEVLDLYDVPEEQRDSAAADDLVDDDRTLGERRRTRDRAATTENQDRQPALIAAAGEEIWALVGGALWHVDARGRTVRSPGRIRRLDHLAADLDGRIIGAAGPVIWQSTDAGVTFTTVARADGPVRAVTAGSGWIAWATDQRLTWTGTPRSRAARPVVREPVDGGGLARGRAGSVALPARALDVRRCGETLLALHERGLLAIDDSGEARAIGAIPAATRLGCDDDGGWWLIGPGLAVSHDGGHSFVTPPGLPPLPIADASPGARGVWLATAAGLFLMGGPPGAAPVAIAPALGAEVRARERARWASLLPRVVIAAIATANRRVRDSSLPAHNDLRTVAYADFPLGARVPATVRAAPGPLSLAWQDAGSPLAPFASVPPDPDAGCLRPARAAAVNLAQADPDRARSHIVRAGRAAWLPELRLRVDHLVGRSESLDVPVGSVTGPLGLDTANDVRYEVRATWDLSRLVFSPDEIAAEAQALRMADVRRELESLVNRLYFERRRLTMDLDPNTPVDPAGHARRQLRAEELDAELDALSGGIFARCLAEQKR